MFVLVIIFIIIISCPVLLTVFETLDELEAKREARITARVKDGLPAEYPFTAGQIYGFIAILATVFVIVTKLAGG